LGLGQNGLASVRSLARASIPVIAIDRDLKSFTARTRLCQKIELRREKDSTELIDVLLELGLKLPSKAVLFPSGDGPVQRLSEHREELEPYYHFSFPSQENVSLALDKKRFYEFAQAHRILIPESYFPVDRADCARIAKQIPYPALIKPYQPNLGWRQRFPGKKLFVADDAAALTALYEELVQVHRDLIVQEIIPGADDKLAFSLTYFDKASKPLGMFTGRKLRQYPPHFGTSSMAESRYDDEIMQRTLDILAAMRYTGYGSVEFKWDPRQKVFKAIEVTVRTWFPHGISTACGLNLLHIAYCDLVGLPVPRDQGFADGVKWIHEDRDLRSALAQIRDGELGIAEWLRSYRGRRTYALAAKDDPTPFLFFLLHLATIPWRSFLRRNRRS
jgi:predicted ATP-grasp superfamily ATP-dependent carboligase